MKLLSRDVFRNAVFERDNHKCVVCGYPAQDAHHIMERRLFHDGGYYIDNGASVCGECHIKCEQTVISVEEIREYAGITKVVVPEHLYPDHSYDKWGNGILENGMRTKGELFYDDTVQKVLKQGGVFHLFTEYVKYPRTKHTPWSKGIHDDDRVHKTMKPFHGQRVIVTEKLDGENTSLYHDYIHARSIDGQSHASRDWVKNFHRTFAHDIPKGWRICGENMYAQHSIAYNNLDSYFYGFSIWNEKNECLSWDETLEWFDLLGIQPVPVLYDGIYDENHIKTLYDDTKHWSSMEGLVIRIAESFPYAKFMSSIAKVVRKDHIQTAKHWKFGQPIIANGLKK
ncbi:hypothetical protein PBI_SCTP2_101 [Salicola phage SCTP-2]|nr:hypothetical protein PBI_SCTP2_101 [Salicola phage SCTP-2]